MSNPTALFIIVKHADQWYADMMSTDKMSTDIMSNIQNVEQTKCRQKKMPSRQNVDKQNACDPMRAKH